jgi:hypothetical protein
MTFANKARSPLLEQNETVRLAICIIIVDCYERIDLYKHSSLFSFGIIDKDKQFFRTTVM